MNLKLNFIPLSTKGVNVRSIKPEKWDEIRKYIYAFHGYRCQICGINRQKAPLECHEQWEWDDEKHMQILTDLLCVCHICHKTIHINQQLGFFYVCFDHLRKINKLTKEEAIELIDEETAKWAQRSYKKYGVDITHISTLNFGRNLRPGKKR
jgi:hypothetical protein